MNKVETSGIIRTRGLDVFVDTLKAAEFDIKGYQISDAVLDEIAKRLKAMPCSPEDEEVQALNQEGIRVRHLHGFDVMFAVSRAPEGVVVTIVGVMPRQEPKVAEKVKIALELVATLRGAASV